MIINFIYKNCDSSVNKEKVITNTIYKTKKFISLPDIIEIEIQNFSSSYYQREYRYVLAETGLWCIMNTSAYYISLCVYFYYCINGNTEMINSSFHAAVLLGLLAILHRR